MNAKPILPIVLATSLLTAVPHSEAALAALWRFDATGVSQADASLNANTASSINGAAWVFDGTRSSGTMSYDGTNDYLQVADSASLSITGDITIAMWINLASAGGPLQWRGLVNKDAVLSNVAGPYQFWLNQGSPTPGFGRGDGAAQDFVFGTAAASTNVWQHWAVTQSGTTATMYVNGNVVALSGGDNQITVTSVDQNGPLIIGDRPGAQDMSFHGRMDDVSIFDQALTQTQIQTIMTGDYSAFLAPVPEPGTAATGLALFAAAALRRRRR